MNVQYRGELRQVERNVLKELLSGGKHASRKLKRAQSLLAADAGTSDEEFARSVGVGEPDQATLRGKRSEAGGAYTHGQRRPLLVATGEIRGERRYRSISCGVP